MYSETLKQFLSLLVRFLPVVYTHCALSPDETAQHELVLVCDTLHSFFFASAVEASNFARSYDVIERYKI